MNNYEINVEYNVFFNLINKLKKIQKVEVMTRQKHARHYIHIKEEEK